MEAGLVDDLTNMAKNQPTVYLIRHGKTALNGGPDSKDRIRGWKDVPLDQQGVREAHDMAGKLKTKLGTTKPGVIHTSDLSRAHDTAQIIANATDSDLRPTQALRPWNAGELQGKLSSDAHGVMAEHAQNKPDTPLPGGESFNKFKNRYLNELHTLMNHAEATGEPQIAVAHYRNQKLAEAHLSARKLRDGDNEIDMPTFLDRGKSDHTGGGLKIYKTGDGGWDYEHF